MIWKELNERMAVRCEELAKRDFENSDFYMLESYNWKVVALDLFGYVFASEISQAYEVPLEQLMCEHIKAFEWRYLDYVESLGRVWDDSHDNT